MEYISVEEFLKQPKEVQEVFKDWWNPSVGDLYCNIYNNQQENVLVINKCQLELFPSFKSDIKQFGFQLLTEGSLRKFIEEHFNSEYSKVELEWDNDGYIVNIVSKINHDKVFKEFYTGKTEPINAYWTVACEIAKEEYIEE